MFKTTDDDGWSTGATLEQKIWDFSKTSSKIDASKIDKDIATLSLKDLQALFSYKVKSFYEFMVLQDEAIKVKKKDLESKEAYYEQAKALVKEGLKTNADASRFLSAVYLAKDNLSNTQSLYKKAKNSLSLYMGEEIADDVVLENTLVKTYLQYEKEIQNDVLDNNYQLKIQNQSIAKNILLHKSAKASHYGSIDAVASYSRVDTLNAYDSKLIGLTLNIPLYTGGRVSAQAQQEEIGIQIAQAQKASKELELQEELDGLLIDIQRYNKTIDAKKAQLTSSKQTKEVLDARYKEGLSTYMEVLDAISLVLSAKLGLLETYYLKNMAVNQIDYLKGKI